MKTVVIGLGNPILGDDGVGWRVAEMIQHQEVLDPGVDVDCLSLGGLGLMEHLIGYQRAILIDAWQSQAGLGTVNVSNVDSLPDHAALHVTSAHDTSLQTALRLGRTLGAQLPAEVIVVGISVAAIRDFGEELSPPIAQAVPRAARIVMDLLA